MPPPPRLPTNPLLARPIVSCARRPPRHLLRSTSIFSSTTCSQSVTKQAARSMWVDHVQDGPRLSTMRHDGIRCHALPCHAIDFHGPAVTSRHGGPGRPFDSCDRKRDSSCHGTKYFDSTTPTHNVTLPLPRLPRVLDSPTQMATSSVCQSRHHPWHRISHRGTKA